MSRAVVKRKRGRPLKFTSQELSDIYDAFDDYINKVDDPTITGFISRYSINDKWIDRDYLQGKKIFRALITKARAKEESYLLSQMKNPTMAIFRLKQPIFGYSDVQKVESTSVNLNIQGDPKLSKDFVAYLKNKTKRNST